MGAVEMAIRDLDFEAAAELEGGANFRLSGNADGAIVTPLTTLIQDIHRQVVDARLPRVLVDIRTLEFMNASCFNVFVSWLNLINDLPPTERYRLHFAINPGIPWQQRSLRTLSCFATDLVEVEAQA
jgi:hypothetical protein